MQKVFILLLLAALLGVNSVRAVGKPPRLKLPTPRNCTDLLEAREIRPLAARRRGADRR